MTQDQPVSSKAPVCATTTALDNYRQQLTSDDAERVRQLLNRRLNWFGFHGKMENMYRTQRVQEFHRTVIEGGPWLVLAHILANFVSYKVRHPENDSNDIQIWLTVLLVSSAGILVGILTAIIPVLRRNFNLVGALSGGLIIFISMTAAQLYENLDLAQDATYVALLAMMVTSLGMQLLLPAVTTALIVPTIVALGTGIITEARIDWLSVTTYALTGIAICLYLAYRLEHIDRKAFLQSLLLSWEGMQLDVANRSLDLLSRRDPLTNLANRRDFNETLLEEWERARREDQPISLVFIDIDHFKLFNDHYGHASGDECLVQVSKVLADALKRPGDLAARFGGEEFVLLLPNTEDSGARRVAERLLKKVDALKIPHMHSRTAGHVSISLGVATRYPLRDNITAQDLLELADAALYFAKNSGRHRYHVSIRPVTAATAEAGASLPAGASLTKDDS